MEVGGYIYIYTCIYIYMYIYTYYIIYMCVEILDKTKHGTYLLRFSLFELNVETIVFV